MGALVLYKITTVSPQNVAGQYHFARKSNAPKNLKGSKAQRLKGSKKALTISPYAIA
jgi:hypothetical protein